MATGLRTEQPKRAREAAATYRDILGPGNFFLEMQYQGIEEQRIVNSGLLPMARDLDLPLVCTNDVHYLRREDRRPHDVLLCIGTGKNVSDEQRLRYHGDQFYVKTGDEMRTVFGDYPAALSNTMAIAERCNVELASDENHLPNFDVPEPFHARRLLRARDAGRVPAAPRDVAAAGRRGAAEAPRRRLRSPARLRDRRHRQDALPRLLPHRVGLHPLRPRAGDSRGAGPGIGGGQPSSPGACRSPTSIRCSST